MSEQDIIQELLNAETDQEIRSAAATQAQIISLISILLEKGVLDNGDVRQWEDRTEETTDHCFAVMRLMQSTGQEDQETLYQILVSGAEGQLAIAEMLGTPKEEMADTLRKYSELIDAATNESQEKKE